MFKIEEDEYQFNGPVRFTILPLKNVGNLKGTTPDVRDNEYWKASDSSTITNFLNGAPGQRLFILGNGTTILQDNANIVLGSDTTLTADKVYILVFFPDQISPVLLGKWYPVIGF